MQPTKTDAGEKLPSLSLVGEWRGSLTAPFITGAYPVIVRFEKGTVGDVIAKVTYPTYTCRSEFILSDRVSQREVLVHEQQVAGACAEDDLRLIAKSATVMDVVSIHVGEDYSESGTLVKQ